MKKLLEQTVINMCECDGECSIDPNEHDLFCAARKYLEDLGY